MPKSLRVKTICFVTTLPITLRTFVLPHALALKKRGWQVTLVSSDDGVFQSEVPEGIRFVSLPVKRGIDAFGSLTGIANLYRLFAEQRFTIVQYSTPNAAFVASTAAFFAGVPVRLYAQWGIRYVGFGGFLRFVFKQVERWVCLCSTVVEPDSRSNLNFAIKEGLYKRSKGRVVGHGSACGVNLKKFDITKKKEWRAAYRKQHAFSGADCVIGFVGSLRKDKGTNELLGACRKIFSKNPDTKLLLIGDKTFYEELDEDLRDWAESSSQVVYIPPTQDVPQYMACMDIFCLPSYREGFGLVIVEAEAMGVPVVVSDVPGPIDAMHDEKTGIVVPVKSVDGLAHGIKKLISDKVLRESFGINAVDFASKNFEQRAFLELLVQDKESFLAS